MTVGFRPISAVLLLSYLETDENNASKNWFAQIEWDVFQSCIKYHSAHRNHGMVRTRGGTLLTFSLIRGSRSAGLKHSFQIYAMNKNLYGPDTGSKFKGHSFLLRLDFYFSFFLTSRGLCVKVWA